MKCDNVIEKKSKAFAVRVVRLARYLQEKKHEYVLSKQLLRSGTSIGANVKEAQRGQSKADFISKMNIALKESSKSYMKPIICRMMNLIAYMPIIMN